MSGQQGQPRPWGPPQPPPSRTRLFVWIGLIAAFGLGLLVLSDLFPGQITARVDGPYLIYYAIWAVVLASSLIASRRMSLSKAMQYAALWGGIALVLIVGYALRDDAALLFDRVRSELVPGYAVQTDPNTLMLSRDDNGNYVAYADVNGLPVKFTVDTGASDIVLSPADAERLGVDLSSLHFEKAYETANGLGTGAPYTISRFKLGPILLFNVQASINGAPMRTSLLGLAFLRRLDSFEFTGSKLYLKWHTTVSRS